MRVNQEQNPNRPRGEAIHRRRILAVARRFAVFDPDERIIEMSQAKQRLAYIDQLLSPDDPTLSDLNDQEREQTQTGVEIERIWLQLKLGRITQEEKKRLLAGKFDELERDKPGVYNWLVARDKHGGLSMAERIRDKVMPPTRVEGYHTKR